MERGQLCEIGNPAGILPFKGQRSVDHFLRQLKTFAYNISYAAIEKDHLGDWSPEKDCC